MMRCGKSVDSVDLEQVRIRFEDWRQSRKGKAHIPGELWSAAVELARRNDVNQTAAALHLDSGKLKRRMMATGPVPDKRCRRRGDDGPARDGRVGVHDRTARPERASC